MSWLCTISSCNAPNLHKLAIPVDPPHTATPHSSTLWSGMWAKVPFSSSTASVNFVSVPRVPNTCCPSAPMQCTSPPIGYILQAGS